MPSAPDENQRSEVLGDILGLNSANPATSIVDSVQAFRNLAHNLSLAEITETEKNVKQILEQLGGLQETLRRVRRLRARMGPVSIESPADTKHKNFSKSSSVNVIPFPLSSRGSEANTSSEPSATARHPNVGVHRSEGHPSTSQGSHIPPIKPEPQKVHEQPSAAPSESLSEKTDQKKKQNSPSREAKTVIAMEPYPPSREGRTVIAMEPYPESEPRVSADTETVQEDAFMPDASRAVIPEVVIPAKEPVRKEHVDLPSKRMAVDKEIKELVKSYGQVDIYTHREQEGGKQNLLKAALAGFLLIAVLAASYFFMR